VISNLKLFPDYYERADLAIAVRHDDPLKQLLEEAGKRTSVSRNYFLSACEITWLIL
jgi:hypothetical protein